MVDFAKLRGFEVRLIYVILSSLDLQLARIRVRVADGGHDVPPDKVKSRRLRSFEQFAWFSQNVSQCYVFDNSTGQPELVAEKVGPSLLLHQDLPEDMTKILGHQGVDLFKPED